MKNWERIPEEELIQKIKEASCFKEALMAIGYTPYSANYKIIREIAEKHNIDISHYKHTTLKDLIGQRFGRLIVLKRDENKLKRHQKRTYWICKCDCGNIVSVSSYHLTKGKTKSCGCYHIERTREACKLDLLGQRFGKLTVIEPVDAIKEPSGQVRTAWRCKCDCGNECIVKTINLRSGDTTSCGCIRSKGEWKINEILKENQFNYKREYSFPDLKTNNGNLMRFDFAIFEKGKLSFLIEFQGLQHYEQSRHFSDIKLEERQKRDKEKEEYCLKNKIPLIIIPYWSYQDITIEYIRKACQNAKAKFN